MRIGRGEIGRGGIGRSVGQVLIISMAARALALVGSMLYTQKFGIGYELDIYSYAVNLPNLVFNCLGTALMTVVIPIFSGRLASGDSKAAYKFADGAMTAALIASAILAVLGVLLAPVIVGAVGRFGDPGLATFALRLMFPVMLFFSAGYVLQGVLQSHGRYSSAAAAAATSGLCVVLYVLFFGDKFGVGGLLVATFAGLAGQTLTLLPSARAARSAIGIPPFRPRLDLSNPDIREAGALTLPVLVASSSYQINMVVNSTFAAAFVGGVVTIANTQNLALVAAQLFILSALSVYFPKMSALYATGDLTGYGAAFAGVLRMISFFAVPASCALAYLSRYLIPLMYGHGLVDSDDVGALCASFSLYAGSIAFIGLKEAADRVFYAARDSRTPAIIGALIMALNVGLGYVLMRRLGLIGLPVAYAVTMAAGSLAALATATLRGAGAPPTGAAPEAAANVAPEAAAAVTEAAANVAPEAAAEATVPAAPEATEPGASGGGGRPNRPGKAPRVALPKGTAAHAAKSFAGAAVMMAAMAAADAPLGQLLPGAAPFAPVAGIPGATALVARLAALVAVGSLAYFSATLALRAEEPSAIARAVSRAASRLSSRFVGSPRASDERRPKD